MTELLESLREAFLLLTLHEAQYSLGGSPGHSHSQNIPSKQDPTDKQSLNKFRLETGNVFYTNALSVQQATAMRKRI